MLFLIPPTMSTPEPHSCQNMPYNNFLCGTISPNPTSAESAPAPAAAAAHDPMQILADSRHPQFREVIARVAATVLESDPFRFCEILASHCAPGMYASVWEGSLIAVRALAAHGRSFYDAALRSSFSTKLYVRTRAQANIVLDFLKPLFHSNLTFLKPANYFTNPTVKGMPSFQDIARFVLGLWSLAIDSFISEQDINVIRFFVTAFWCSLKGRPRNLLEC
jgi:hypothetical protein